MKGLKWKAWLAIVFITMITIFDIRLGWSLFFLAWLVPDLITGRTWLFEPITKKDHPITYWAVMILWSLVISLMILEHFYSSN